MWQELRYAVKGLVRRPVFTTAVVITLGLGLGANTAIFSVVRAVILQPLPYRDPDRLVRVWETTGTRPRFTWGEDKAYIIVRPGTLHEWRTQSRSFEDLEAIAWRSKTLSGLDRAETVWANEVTSRFFAAAGMPAALGRTLQESDFAPGAPTVVVLSDWLWRARFGADRSIVGRTIQLDGTALPVVGVMPPGFYPYRYNRADLWIQRVAIAGESTNWTSWTYTTLARLRPGVTLDEAQQEMDLISARLRAAFPDDYKNMSAVVVPVRGEVGAPYERLLFSLFAAVGLVLLIACVNVANLMLTRALERRQELGLRVALGAGRGRLVRQLLTECLVLSILGGALGIAFAWAALHPILAMIPTDRGIPRIGDARLDGIALAFAALASIVTGIVFGIAPAWRASRLQPGEVLKEGGRGGATGRRERRLGDAVVAVEIALTLPLLVAAVLLVRSFTLLEARDSGFDDEHVLALQLTPPTHVYGPYQTGGQNPSRATLYRTLERAMAALPGVTSVSISGLMPLRHGVNPWGITIEGRGAPAEPLRDGTAVSNRQGRYHHGSIAIERVGPAYFHTLGIPLVRGRYIDERDDANGPLVTVVSETMAKKFFPGENPIGRRITADMTSYFPTLTIVGVVADNRMHGLDHDPYPLLYWSMSQFPSASAWLLVKARGPAGTFGPRVAAEIGRVAPDVPVSNVMTLNAARSESLWRQRFTAVMLGLFAIVALGLAAAGVYGVIAYSVSRRLREMAIRLALGANVSGILRLVVWSAVRPCLAGTVIGLGFYLAAKRLLDGQLVGVPATDPTILAAVSALPIAIGVIASFVPARRLLRRLDAAHALR